MIHIKNILKKRKTYKKEAECSRLVGSRFNKQGSLPARFVFCKRSRSSYLPDRTSGVSREALMDFSHYPVWMISMKLYSQGCCQMSRAAIKSQKTYCCLINIVILVYQLMFLNFSGRIYMIQIPDSHMWAPIMTTFHLRLGAPNYLLIYQMINPWTRR